MRSPFYTARGFLSILVVCRFIFGATSQRDFLSGSQKIAQIKAFAPNSTEPFYQFDFEYDRSTLERVVLRDGISGELVGTYEFSFERKLLTEQQQYDSAGDLLQTLTYSYGSDGELAEITWTSATAGEPERSNGYDRISDELVVGYQQVEGGNSTVDSFFIDREEATLSIRSSLADNPEDLFWENRYECDEGRSPLKQWASTFPSFCPTSY
ncbi:MAG: hypothetical protein AAF399_29140 [Bacteroidota bacterium]